MKLLFGFLAAAWMLLLGGAELSPQKIYGPGDMTEKKLGARCVFSDGNLKSALEDGVWRTSGEPAGKKSWSCFGVQFANPRQTAPIGFRLEIAPPRPVTVGVEARENSRPEKGFWSSKPLGGNRFSLPAGRQFIEKSWNELKVPAGAWDRVNAVTLSVREAIDIPVLGFELIYAPPSGNNSELVNWFDAGQNEINPVARPFDKLTSVFCCQQGGAWTSALDLGKHPGADDARPFWGVGGNREEKGWALYGFGFADRVEPSPAGLSFELYVTAPVTLNIQPVREFNARRTKGFYSARDVGKPRRVSLAAGKQVLGFRWADFGLNPEEAAAVNGVKFSGPLPGDKVFFDRIDLIFADAATADRYRAVAAQRLNSLQKVLIDALAARGVDWKKALAPLSAEEAEPLIWVAMQLSAQREQIDYFRKLSAAASEPAPELPGLLARRDALAAEGARGEFEGLKAKTAALQNDLDPVIDRLLARIPPEKRRFRYDEADRQFRYPDGRPFRMFGPHFFRSMFRPGYSEWRPWDIRYLSGLGFNGIRIQVRWSLLEAERGVFEPGYLGIITGILKEAERYGFGASIDLHWSYPAWFNAGKPGFPPARTASLHNCYQWPEALVDTWTRLGSVFADHPNIVAFEVPTNETNIGSGKGGLADWPNLVKLWNEFLKEEYGTRENLDAVWRAAGDKYGLAPEEDWDRGTIRPLGYQNDVTLDEAYRSNPRLYDHLRFTARMQTMLSGDIVKALRKSIPDARGMFQRTIGDIWDKSPVPLNYHGIITCIGENVLPGTHYDMGSITARKAATLSLGSYDSEQQMEGNRNAVERHVALGLGFCPFAFHFRGGGGMLLADDDWHLKPEVGYLPLMAAFVRESEPKPATGTRVAVITNSRLEATTGRLVGDLAESLAARNCRVGVFDSLRIVSEPRLLDGYQLAVTTSNYLDVKLLDVLRKFPGQVLLFGRLDTDAYARGQKDGLPGCLVRNGLFVRSLPLKSAGTLAGAIDLAGNWDFHFEKSGPAPSAPPKNIPHFETMLVPSMWGEEGITGSLNYRIGDGWYRREISLPASWKGRPLRLQIGGIDDIDWVFFNGRLIGKTGENVPNYWLAPRDYAIPPELIRYDAPNELFLCVRNLRGDGGIFKGPVVLTGQAKGVLDFGGEQTDAPCGGMTTLLAKSELHPSARAVALFRTPESAEEYAALVHQDNLWWYFKDRQFDTREKADAAVLKTVMQAVR